MTTINSITRSISHAIASAAGGGSSTSSTSVAEGQRNLAYPDELMRLADPQQLVLIDNLNPIKAKRVKYYEHAELKDLNSPAQVPPQPS